MAKFTEKKYEGTLTPQPNSPPNVTNQKPKATDSPSQSSTQPTASVHKYALVYRMLEGEVERTREFCDGDTLATHLREVAQYGITFTTSGNIVWYSPNEIRKVTAQPL